MFLQRVNASDLDLVNCFVSRASSRRFAPWALGSHSSVHPCRGFSSALLLRIPLCSHSFSKSSFFLCLKLGSLLENSHACSFLSRRRCTFSARPGQRSTHLCRSLGLVFPGSWRFWAPSSPVALMWKSTSWSTMAFAFTSRAADRVRPSRGLGAREALGLTERDSCGQGRDCE